MYIFFRQPGFRNISLSCAPQDIEPWYDVIVIGSGYGGAVAASRAARAGQKVCVLERGKEWRPGDFPETEVDAVREVQMTSYNSPNMLGKECIRGGRGWAVRMYSEIRVYTSTLRQHKSGL